VADLVAPVRVEDRGPDREEGRVGGGWGGRLAPDYAMKDGWGHECAIEEGRMGHGVCVCVDVVRLCSRSVNCTKSDVTRGLAMVPIRFR
jgi:hypothetical protein